MNNYFKSLKKLLIFKYLNFIESKKKFKSGNFNKIIKLGQHIKYSYNIIGDNNSIVFEDSKSNNCRIYIRGNNNNIKIGSNCFLKNTIMWIEGDGCLLKINSFTTIESAHIALTGIKMKVLVGEDCMISTNVTIRTGDSHSIYDKTTNEFLNNNSSVIIEDHVWIGDDVTILKGVKISSGSIVGAKSLVTKDVPTNSVSVGIPSKVVKNNIIWKR